MKYMGKQVLDRLSTEFALLGINYSAEMLISRYTAPDDSIYAKFLLSNLGMVFIPMGTLKELALGHLDLSANKIALLPDNFGDLRSLEILYLSGNLLKDLPISIGNLSKLRMLGISNNTLVDIPDSIGDLNYLTHLDLSSNKFDDIPSSIIRLRKLRQLKMDFNFISNISECFVTEDLESLYLRNNGISKLPEGFADLKKLKFLDIRFNQFTKVPKALYHMENLQELHIMGNNFQFPDKIANLDKIEWELSPDRRYYLDKEGEYYKLSNLRYNDYDDYHHNIKPEKVIRYYAPDSIPSFIK